MYRARKSSCLTCCDGVHRAVPCIERTCVLQGICVPLRFVEQSRAAVQSAVKIRIERRALCADQTLFHALTVLLWYMLLWSRAGCWTFCSRSCRCWKMRKMKNSNWGLPVTAQVRTLGSRDMWSCVCCAGVAGLSVWSTVQLYFSE